MACRSSRLGIARGDLLDPALEQRPGVVRSRAGLRVELDGRRAYVGRGEALHRVVVEGEVGRLPRLRRRDREAVVLGGDEDAPGRPLEHGMVRAAVPERQLERLEAERLP